MRIVIADDTMLIREGTARLLEDAGFEIVGKADDAPKLLRAVALDHPDVAMSTSRCRPPTPTKARGSEQIRAAHPQVGVLVLSQYLESRTPCGCSNITPKRPDTCSRNGSQTSPS